MKKNKEKSVTEGKRATIARIKSVVADLSSDESLSESVLDDMRYYLNHYDPSTGLAPQRGESWALNWAVLGMLEFNLRLMMKKIESVPDRVVRQAKREVSASATDGVAPRRVLSRATQLWKAELGALDEAIRLYRHYADWGIVKRGAKSRSVPAAVRSAPIPRSEGDLKRLRAKYWRRWTGLYRKIGQDLWN